MVIKQNLLKILADKAEEYQIEHQDDETESDYQKRLIMRFNPTAITDYIAEEEKRSNMLNEEIQNILSVLYILKKIEVFKETSYDRAYADKDKPKEEDKIKFEKARDFREDLSKYVMEIEGYESIEEFLTEFNKLILQI